ncbi:MAG: ATP-binding protein [Marinovum sp.]|nr:ATP-binding protein [Marinovum sp.]
MALYFGLMSAVVIGSMSYIFAHQRTLDVEARQQLWVDYITATLRDAVMPSLLEGRVPKFEVVYDEIAQNHDVRLVQIVDKDGRLLAEEPSGDTSRSVDQDLRLFQAVETRERLTRFEDNFTKVIEPLYVGKTLYGTLLIEVSNDGLRTAKWLVYKHEFIIGTVFIFLSGSFGLWISRRMTSELKFLARAAENAADGNLDQNLTLLSKDELGRLGRSFEKMLGNLKDRVATLENAHARMACLSTTLEAKNTELEAALQEAHAADVVKTQFLATMSHELRTPLNGVIGVADLLDESDLNERDADLVNTIRLSGGNLLHIINSILDFSKLDADHMELEATNVDLRALLDETRRIFEVNAMGKGVTITTQVDEDVPHVLIGDPGRLRQIVSNLVGNAVKFTDHGSVTIRAELSQDGNEYVRVSVRDTGVGIPIDKLEHVFDQFTQVDTSFSRRHEGTGLGLAICKRLVTLMGGQIAVMSEENEGSEFFFSIPMPRGVEQPEGVSSPDVIEEAPNWNVFAPYRRALIADDSAVNRKVLSTLLKSRGLPFEEASNGGTAVEWFLTGAFDLIFMDVSMPVMDGLEATRAIRAKEQDAGLRPCRIIGLTAHASIADRDACLNAGMDLHLSKPVRIATLSQALTVIDAGVAQKSA